MRYVVLLLSKRQKKSQPVGWPKKCRSIRFSCCALPAAAVRPYLHCHRVTKGGSRNRFVFTSRGMNFGGWILSAVYWKEGNGVNQAPGSCPIERKSLWESNSHRSTGFSFQHTRASGELVRGVPAFIRSVGILPAGPPLTRSLYIRKLHAQNRYHFSKIGL